MGWYVRIWGRDRRCGRRRNAMREKRYLLNIGQMLEESGGILFREAFDHIDRERRQKVLSLKNVRAQAAGIGAGLLIQKAMTDYMAYCRMECQTILETGCLKGSGIEPGTGQSEQREQPKDSGVAEKPVWERFSVGELLPVLDRTVPEPCYRYGKRGKPYLETMPFQFNLSHSGDYVFCGVSGQEIGVDIQKIQGGNILRLAKRFFADPECKMLENCMDGNLRCRMFFRMWVRKEAYGKLTGEGIAEAVGKCFWQDMPAGEEAVRTAEKGLWQEGDLIWEEYDKPDGYRIAVCRKTL